MATFVIMTSINRPRSSFQVFQNVLLDISTKGQSRAGKKEVFTNISDSRHYFSVHFPNFLLLKKNLILSKKNNKRNL